MEPSLEHGSDLRIGIVAGETSGDYLGAGLMRALTSRYPRVRFEGIGGEKMAEAGLESMYPMSSISVMGVDGLLRSVAHILRIRQHLFEHFRDHPPHLFVGVDVPDFNLGLEKRLKRDNIDTVHYVSPTVWAWRGYRIRKIRRAVSHMLTMFPFEATYYRRHDVPVTFVGHPIADEIDDQVDVQAVRRELGLSAPRVVALLPGSRVSELRKLGQLFLQTAARLARTERDVEFVVPLANSESEKLFHQYLDSERQSLPLVVVRNQARNALAAADTALLASGTAALEAALVGTPMVVAYKVSWLTALMVRLFAHVEHFSMPNHLLSRPIVPELLQGEATVDKLTAAVRRYLDDPQLRSETKQAFAGITETLRRNANERAADAIVAMLQGRPAVQG